MIRADVTRFPVQHLADRVEGVVISPPCGAFSAAGLGEGRRLVGYYVASVHDGRWDGPRLPGSEVLEVGRWVEALQPRWVACEQVPAVYPIWHAYAKRWRRFGWSTWAGVLDAASYGVPQHRQRAFLIARTDGGAALPPEPTHARRPGESLFGQTKPWVSMAAALGLQRTLHTNRDQRPDGTRQTVPGSAPAPALTAEAGRQWMFDRPATTIAGDPRCWPPGHKVNADDRARLGDEEANARYGDRAGTGAIKLTVGEALTLQGFRADYPLQGTKTSRFRQIGNAVPPPLAAAVVGSLLGLERKAAAA